MSRMKPTDPGYADQMNNPLPGAVMPTGGEEKLIPEKVEGSASDNRTSRPQYTDRGDHHQTIPV